MTKVLPLVSRRRLLRASVGAPLLALPYAAPAIGGNKPLDGITLNVSCWSSPYPVYLTDYIKEFEELTGAKVNYSTPSFPIYNQRMDLELSTKSAAYDVVNITFIFSGRWIGAGWFTPIDEYVAATPKEWGTDDFASGSVVPFKDAKGRLYGIPWIADVMMAGSSRFDLFQQASLDLPKTFDEVPVAMKAVHNRDGIPAFAAENHYGWDWISWLHGFGGDVFRAPPDDLMPVLDSPEAIAAADYFATLMRNYGPEGVVTMTYDQLVTALKAGRVNYSGTNQAFLVQMGNKDSKVGSTNKISMFPSGPKGSFPQVAAHAWGIPVGSKQKDAAWEFIKWSMSRDMVRRMGKEHAYTSITRNSVIAEPEFKERSMINGTDVAAIYKATLERGGAGYMKYRTVPIYPQVDKQIDIALSSIISGQASAKDAMKTAQANSITAIKRSGIKL